MENSNSREELEKRTKIILDNLKNVQAITVDQSSYRKGGNQEIHRIDASDYKQYKEDMNQDKHMDTNWSLLNFFNNL